MPLTPKIASIVTQTATLAAAPTGDTAREIWKISEVSSTSDENSRDKLTPYHECNRNKAVMRQLLKGSERSEINKAYIEASSELDEGDDDVFLDDFYALADYLNDDEMRDSVDSISTDSENVPVKRSLNALRTKCLSSSSPQLTRSLFLVEAESPKETQPKKFLRSGSVVERNELKTINNYAFSGSPAESIKLSPLKAVGEFLLNHGPKSSKLNLNNESNPITEKYTRKENSISVN